MAVFTPITWPLLSSSGPPLLPGLIAASVWIMSSSRESSSRIVRPSELITPVVKVPSSPNGLPIANTFWPTLRFSESPIVRYGISLSGSMRISARVVRLVEGEDLGVITRLVMQKGDPGSSTRL